MATIAIGDVHGNLAALSDLLDQVRHELTASDTVVFLGDYIDRGPDSKGCVDAILRFKEEVSADVVCLLGNHEEWFLKTMRDHTSHSWLLGMEAFDTMGSYSADAEGTLREAASRAGAALYLGPCALPYEAFFDCVPADHRRFFEGLGLFHRTADCLCAHAGLDPRVARFEDQHRRSFVWGANGFPEEYAGDEVIVYGHRNNATVDARGWPNPTIAGATIGLDTISHGVLTAARLPDRRVFQSARHRAPDRAAS